MGYLGQFTRNPQGFSLLKRASQARGHDEYTYLSMENVYYYSLTYRTLKNAHFSYKDEMWHNTEKWIA